MTTRPRATILVVEDIDIVLQHTCEILRKDGFKVLSASDGEQALKIYQESPDKIDLILTDVIMPGKDGMQLMENVKAIDPEMKVILTSVIPLPEGFRQEHPGCNFLRKTPDLTKLPEMLKKYLQYVVFFFCALEPGYLPYCRI
jgi:DNA-binding NtrC family response regulator